MAPNALGWLRPSGHLVLCWSTSPRTGQDRWQQALSEVLDQWRSKLSARSRVPQGWEHARQVKLDLEVLADAGFEVIGRHEFQVEHRWTIAELAGFAYFDFVPARSRVRGLSS